MGKELEGGRAGGTAYSRHAPPPPAPCTRRPPQALFENGFLFDSTLLETGQSESLSKSFGERVWPYTMDFGVAQNTAWFETQVVNASERWPGLWEVPLYVLQAFGLEWSMDVGARACWAALGAGPGCAQAAVLVQEGRGRARGTAAAHALHPAAPRAQGTTAAAACTSR